ncbi:MAG: hypothetical protein N2035_10355, partial [Chthoniobacterales bacterium]|nr:hypothetical protein [Chthoniobacterales bacterium]
GLVGSEMCIRDRCGCATELEFFLPSGVRISRLVCGLPWTGMSEELQETILSKFEKILDKGGIFVTFAYYGLHFLPGGRSFRRKLLERFDSVNCSRVVWCNIPPAFIYRCVGK